MSDRGVPSRPVRVLICDDHALFRRGLRAVLEADDRIEIAGEAADGVEAVAMAQDVNPDVVLLDVRMPLATGIEAARSIRDSRPGTKIVMVTVSDDDADLFAAIRAGASGYLLKEVAVSEISAVVLAVDQGQSFVTPSMTTRLLAEFVALAEKSEARSSAITPNITDRELEVLRLVARGMSNRQIATELYISENTVKNHVRNILEKLHLHTRMEAVMYAVREQLLDASDT